MNLDNISRQLARQAMRRLEKSQRSVDKKTEKFKRRLDRGIDKPFSVTDAVRELAKDATSK